jgi:hypothetical protein
VSRVSALLPLPLPTCYLHLQLLLPGRRRTCSVHTKKKHSQSFQPEADFRHSTLVKMLTEGCDRAGRLSSQLQSLFRWDSQRRKTFLRNRVLSPRQERAQSLTGFLHAFLQAKACIAGRSPVLETSAGLALVRRIKSSASLSLVTVAGSFGPDCDLSCRWGWLLVMDESFGFL